MHSRVSFQELLCEDQLGRPRWNSSYTGALCAQSGAVVITRTPRPRETSRPRSRSGASGIPQPHAGSSLRLGLSSVLLDSYVRELLAEPQLPAVRAGPAFGPTPPRSAPHRPASSGPKPGPRGGSVPPLLPSGAKWRREAGGTRESAPFLPVSGLGGATASQTWPDTGNPRLFLPQCLQS